MCSNVDLSSRCLKFLPESNVYEGTCCLAWGVIFDRRKDRGVVCVFSILKAGGSVCGSMCVYTRAHTHTAQMRYSV